MYKILVTFCGYIAGVFFCAIVLLLCCVIAPTGTQRSLEALLSCEYGIKRFVRQRQSLFSSH